MAKTPPSTKPRKPPPAVGAEASVRHDAFVRGEAPPPPGKAVQRPSVPTASAASKDSVRFHQPRKGRDVRRMTVYLPASLAKRLAVHCAENDQSLSEVIAASLEKTL
jgi:hypothetical protein